MTLTMFWRIGMSTQWIHVVGGWSPAQPTDTCLLCKEKRQLCRIKFIFFLLITYLCKSFLSEVVRGLPSQSLSGILSPGIGNLTNLQSV